MIGSIVGGLTGIASGIIGSGKRKRETAAAQAEFNKNKSSFESLDTSNVYSDMENTMEDLTVNTQQADFVAQQQNQGMANTMNSLQGAAGGSGIAALAQTMANQGSMDAQKSAVSIGKQEQGNQMAERQMQGQLNAQEAQGDARTQDLERDKQATLLGMSQSDVAAQGQKVAAADAKMWSGITGAAGSLAGGLTGMSNAGKFGGTGNTNGTNP